MLELDNKFKGAIFELFEMCCNNNIDENNRYQTFYPPYSIIFHYSKQRKKDVNNETDED